MSAPAYRSEPPLGPPPAYSRAITRVYTRDLRPPLLGLTALTAAWCIWAGANNLHDLGDIGETSKMKVFDIILGAILFVVGVVDLYGFIATWTSRLQLVKLYAFLVTISALTLFGVQILALVLHFVLKIDLINQCVAWNQGNTEVLGTVISSQDIQNYCNDSWNRGIFYDIAWLMAAAVFGFFTAGIAVAYYHQLASPAFGRSTAASAAYRLNPYGVQDPPFVAPPAYPAGPVDAKNLPSPEKSRDFDSEPGTGDPFSDTRQHENLSDVTLTGRDSVDRTREGSV